MKLLDHFKTFINDHVNLNSTRIDQLETSIEAVKSAVKASSWGPEVISFAPHGSWAHQTIIKPLTNKEFDADLLVFVKPKEGWTARDYVNKLATALEANSSYKDKVRRYSHCATIEYAGERRIDIAPCVVNRRYIGQFEVCNRNAGETGEFEASEPLAYTDWVIEKNSIAGWNDLKKVTRLLKYLRDVKGNFTCPSFLFTTLLGNQVYQTDKDSLAFADLPTVLKTLIGRLDAWLQLNSTVPAVMNPVLSSENQSQGWTQAQYSNFREKINLYRGWIDDAYDEADRDESIGKWQRVFGEKFAAGEAKQSARISESFAKDGSSLVVYGQFQDLVDRVKAVGARAVPAKLTKLPHVRRPKWRQAGNLLTPRVTADLYTGRYGTLIRQVVSLEPLQNDYWLKFTATNTHGLPLPPDYVVKWRVANTDTAADEAGQLRGDFYDSDAGNSRMENLLYRGVHFVEAFIVRKTDDRLVGQSQPFYVVIE
jgi:Second Messenger Oligonucleotide or Dinucleotide Synthetase domain/Adenylyl/Guanylyl and SMODS C-terminal sensor domain